MRMCVSVCKITWLKVCVHMYVFFYFLFYFINFLPHLFLFFHFFFFLTKLDRNSNHKSYLSELILRLIFQSLVSFLELFSFYPSVLEPDFNLAFTQIK